MPSARRRSSHRTQLAAQSGSIRDSRSCRELVRIIDRLERFGTDAISVPTSAVGPSGRLPGKWFSHPNRAQIQQLYHDALHSCSKANQGRVLKGYVANHPISAWDPNSWFMDYWWQLRTRRDPHALQLLKAIAAGVQAAADLGMAAPRAREVRQTNARRALKNWRVHAPALGTLLREYRSTARWARQPDHEDLADRAAAVQRLFKDRFRALTGYTPTQIDIEKSPLSRILLKAASKAFGVPERYLHDRPRRHAVAR